MGPSHPWDPRKRGAKAARGGADERAVEELGPADAHQLPQQRRFGAWEALQTGQ